MTATGSCPGPTAPGSGSGCRSWPSSATTSRSSAAPTGPRSTSRSPVSRRPDPRQLRRDAADARARRDVTGHDGERGDLRVLADGDAALERRPGADPRAGSDHDRRGVDALQAHGLLDVAVALLEVDRHRL